MEKIKFSIFRRTLSLDKKHVLHPLTSERMDISDISIVGDEKTRKLLKNGYLPWDITDAVEVNKELRVRDNTRCYPPQSELENRNKNLFILPASIEEVQYHTTSKLDKKKKYYKILDFRKSPNYSYVDAYYFEYTLNGIPNDASLAATFIDMWKDYDRDFFNDFKVAEKHKAKGGIYAK